MAVIQKYPTADYSAAPLGMILPVMDNLEGIFIFGGSLAKSAKNLAPGKPDATVVGSPVVGATYLDLTGNGSAYLQTAIAHTEDLTWISACRPLTDINATLISNYSSNSQEHGGTTLGGHLYLPVGTSADDLVQAAFGQAYDVSGTSTNATATTASPGFAIGEDYLIAGRVNQATRVRRVDNITDGIFATNTPALNPADLGQPLRIGSTYNSQFAGQVRLYMAVMYSATLSDADLTQVGDAMRAYEASKGVTV